MVAIILGIHIASSSFPLCSHMALVLVVAGFQEDGNNVIGYSSLQLYQCSA